VKKGDIVRVDCLWSRHDGKTGVVELVGTYACCVILDGDVRLTPIENAWLKPIDDYASLGWIREGGYWRNPNYEAYTDANIASAVAKENMRKEMEVQFVAMVIAAAKGDDRSAPWDAHAEYVFYTLLANEREG
jgi:hypothetical protein